MALGLIAEQQRRYGKARTHYGRALAPEDAEARFRLGRMPLALGYLQEGTEWLDRALLVEPLHPNALWRRGLRAIDLGDLPAAERAFARSRELSLAWAQQGSSTLAVARGDLAAARAAGLSQWLGESYTGCPPFDEAQARVLVTGLYGGTADEQAAARALIDACLAKDPQPISGGLVRHQLLWSTASSAPPRRQPGWWSGRRTRISTFWRVWSPSRSTRREPARRTPAPRRDPQGEHFRARRAADGLERHAGGRSPATLRRPLLPPDDDCRSKPPNWTPRPGPGAAAPSVTGAGLLAIERREWRALILAFVYFFALLTCYYMLRSVREAMGVRVGPEHYARLYGITFLCMLVAQPLYGALVARFPRRVFIPVVYVLFALSLALLTVAFGLPGMADRVASVFYVWVSVANLFLVAVFWSFMTDIFDSNQSKRLFGYIAAGGSAGGLAGAGLTALLAVPLGVQGVMGLALVLLLVATGCSVLLAGEAGHATAHARPEADEAIVGGTSFAAFRLLLTRVPLRWLAALTLLNGVGGGLLYLEQGYAVRDLLSDDGARTAYFARIDLAVNVLALLLEIFAVRWLFQHLGVARLMAAMPLMLCASFLVMTLAPSVLMIALAQVLSRGLRFAFGETAQSACYTTLDRELRYKGKALVDTFIYRLSDVLTQYGLLALRTLGLAGAGLYLFGALTALVAAGVGYVAGRGHERRAAATRRAEAEHSPGPA